MMPAPMLAEEVDINRLTEYLTSPSWRGQQKFDGHRIFIGTDTNGETIFITRNGTEYTRKVPKGLHEIRLAPGAYMDGELVGQKYMLFDYVFRHHPRPYSDRRLRLEQVYGAASEHLQSIGVELVAEARTEEEKIALAQRAIDQHAEGLVMKHVDGGYAFGRRSDTWRKLKFTTTADCIVRRVRDDGKESCELAVHDNGTPVTIGRASLIGKEKRGEIKVGDVVEVKYLYFTADGRLYQPRIVRKRTDKTPAECTLDQLRFTDKTVLI